MTRSPLVLAALASSAVPGLDPVAVRGVAGQAGGQFDVAFVQDSQDRSWVVRAPVSPAASAQMELSVALLGLLARRLPFGVPAPRGFAALKDGGRAMVYPRLPGSPIDLAALPAGPGLAAEVGRTLAQLHNLDLALYEEAGVPSYDPEGYRSRRLAELDRAAATGSVPSALLGRWEAALEDLTLWRFAPTPTHGALTGRHVLVDFDADEAENAAHAARSDTASDVASDAASDAARGHVRAVTGWEHAQVADPADDLAGLVAYSSPGAVDSALEAYAHARAERPDPHLRRRAVLAGELAVVGGLLRALTSDQDHLAQFQAARLRELEARVADGSAQSLVAPEHPAVATAPPAPSTAEGQVPAPDSSGMTAEPTIELDASSLRAAMAHDADSHADPYADPDADAASVTDAATSAATDEEDGYDLAQPGGDPSTQGHRAAGRAGTVGSAGTAEETELLDVADLRARHDELSPPSAERPTSAGSTGGRPAADETGAHRAEQSG